MAFALEFRDYDLRSFFLDESERESSVGRCGQYARVFYWYSFMCGFGNQRVVGVFSLCAASNENDAFVVHICPELVRVHRFRRPRAFVNSSFIFFWIIHKMIR